MAGTGGSRAVQTLAALDTTAPWTVVDVLTGAGLLGLVGAIGGAIAWIVSRLDRRDDARRNDRDYWTDVLGIKELQAEHRAEMADVDRRHRVEMAQQRDEHREQIDGLHDRLNEAERKRRRGSVRHQQWDERTRADLIALGSPDPGPPPPIYDTDDPAPGRWHVEHTSGPPDPRSP